LPVTGTNPNPQTDSVLDNDDEDHSSNVTVLFVLGGSGGPFVDPSSIREIPFPDFDDDASSYGTDST
jgi:hypothetical protein